MKLRFEQLTQHLAKQLAPLYLVSGDDYCLVDNTVSAIRQQAQRADYTEREVITVESGFNWHHLHSDLQTASLFSQRRIVEIHIPSGKPGDAGSQFMQRYSAQINPDILVILILPKVESASTKSKWWQAIDNAGVILQIWPLDATGLRRWVTQQCQQANIQLEPASIELLLTQTQNNLLATQQEIQKLALLFTPGTRITPQQLCDILQDQSDFTVFDLVDACNRGDTKQALHVLQKLQFSGVEPILILWALTRELRQIYAMLLNLQTGMTLDAVLQATWLPLPRKQALSKALTRLSLPMNADLLQAAISIDSTIKGAVAVPLWPALDRFCLTYCGQSL